MLLLFNTDRALARIAVEARRSEWRRPTVRCSTPAPPITHASRPTATDRRPGSLRHTLELGLVGGPDRMGEALTADAEGWSPSLCFSSRQEVVDALRDRTATLTVADFTIDQLRWSDPIAFAEWHLEARQTEPLLIGDDVLIEGRDRPVHLAGATVAELRYGRIAQMHTYYDDAALIEQVLVGRLAAAHHT